MLPNLGTRFFVILVVLLIPTLMLLFGGDFNKGLDIQGGTSLIYNVPGNPTDQELGEVKDVMSRRVDRLGLKEITITTDNRRKDIVIELPGMDAKEAFNVKRTLLELGKLLWAIEANEDELTNAVDGLGPTFNKMEFLQRQAQLVQQRIQSNPDQFDQLSYTGEPVSLYRNPADFTRPKNPGDKPLFTYYPPYRWKSRKIGATGERMWKGPSTGAIIHNRSDMRFQGDKVNNVYPTMSKFEAVVAFDIKPEFKDEFRTLTRKNVQRNLCIIFNEKLVTNPVIQSVLPGSGIIQGIGEREEIRNLIVTIKSGSLKIKPVLFMEQQIGPTLGEDAIRQGTMAIVVGMIMVIVFMVLVYRVGGVLAVLALAMNLIVLLGIMQMMQATLSLPAIAGIILTVGIAVDANILIFERVKEEREKGKTFIQSLKNGYDRATVTILDANITTLITGLVLYMFGTGAVKGFAFVLIAGLLVNLFTAIYMTKTVLAWLVDRKRISDLKVVRVFQPPKLDFLGAGKIAMILSGLAIIGGLYVFFAVQGKEIRGLDFSGGALMRLKLQEPMDIAEFRRLVWGIKDVGQEVDIITVKGRQSITLPTGDGSNIFEIKKSFDQDDVAQAETFFKTVRTGLKDLLVGDPIVPYVAPTGSPYRYGGKDGEDPGRVPQFPPDKQASTEEEQLIVQTQGGYRFTVNFFAPIPKTILEQNLNLINAKQISVKPLGKADPQGRHWSYEVWCQAPGYLPGVKSLTDLGSDLRNRLKEEKPPVHLSDPIPVQRFIGPRVAQDLVKKAILAIIVSIIALIIYIRIRFHDLTYGLGASIALVHDVLITMGAIAVFDQLGIVNVKITLPIIAAFLTIIGYSLNDTIVILDRLRENLGRMDMPLKEAMNLSITQSLTRTFFTSITTFFVVFCLFAFNYGERGVLEGLGFALMVGVVAGTYSTIFIACPTVLYLNPGRTRPGQAEAKAKPKAKTA